MNPAQIVLIEDNPADVLLIELALKENGIACQLTRFTNGEEALRSDPEEGAADSILALDMASGKVTWQRKVLVGDRWNVACISGDKTGCPEKEGPDFDFGSSPILHTLANGKQVLLAGQKSGITHMACLWPSTIAPKIPQPMNMGALW